MLNYAFVCNIALLKFLLSKYRCGIHSLVHFFGTTHVVLCIVDKKQKCIHIMPKQPVYILNTSSTSEWIESPDKTVYMVTYEFTVVLNTVLSIQLYVRTFSVLD